MSHTSISLVCPDQKGTVYTIESISRLLARLDPEDLAEESDIVGELLAAISDAARTIASSIPYSEPTRPAPSALDLTDTRTPAAGWNLVQ